MLMYIIALFIIGIPIGVFLYLNNVNKINSEFRFRAGFVIQNNMCGNYSLDNRNLLTEIDVDFINSNNKSQSLVGLEIIKMPTFDIYRIKFKEKISEENENSKILEKILSEVSRMELLNFNTIYKSIQNDCKPGRYSVYKMVPMGDFTVATTRQDYKTKHLYALLLSPLIILYLLLISYKYIQNRKFF
jgi:hypothetical protein